MSRPAPMSDTDLAEFESLANATIHELVHAVKHTQEDDFSLTESSLDQVYMNVQRLADLAGITQPCATNLPPEDLPLSDSHSMLQELELPFKRGGNYVLTEAEVELVYLSLSRLQDIEEMAAKRDWKGLALYCPKDT